MKLSLQCNHDKKGKTFILTRVLDITIILDCKLAVSHLCSNWSQWSAIWTHQISW